MTNSNVEVYAGPFSGELAKRLAGAADGLRDGKFYYFIARISPLPTTDPGYNPYDPYDLEIYGDLNQTTALNNATNAFNAKQDPSNFAIFGPYNSAADPSVNYDKLKITFIKGNVEYSITFDSPADAMVFSLAAYDKFYMPYYTSLYGPAVANAMREGLEYPVMLKSAGGDSLQAFLAGHDVGTGGKTRPKALAAESQEPNGTPDQNQDPVLQESSEGPMESDEQEDLEEDEGTDE